MDSVAVTDTGLRRQLFAETAARMDLPPVVIEKDFWVCWVLKRLFGLAGVGDRLIFKGGTTLSKVHRIIERFSEDIDLTLDRGLFGFDAERDPAKASGSKDRERRLKAMGVACAEYVQDVLRSAIKQDFAGVLGPAGSRWDVTADQEDRERQSLLFRYPEGAGPGSSFDYVATVVKLEFGSRGDSWPTSPANVTPYAAEQFPALFGQPSCAVTALDARRTFWEKATILHQEAHRSAAKRMSGRSSRHYYDLAMLARSPFRARALADLDLLARVVQHKIDFFRCGWAQYDQAKPGSMRLVPPESRLKELRDDYAEMGVMMFGTPPSFDEVLQDLRVLEAEINGLAP